MDDVDNLRVHHSKIVKEWLDGHKDRIELVYLPSYSSELNPDEYLNNHLKQTVTRTGPPSSKDALDLNVRSSMVALQNNPDPVAELNWPQRPLDYLVVFHGVAAEVAALGGHAAGVARRTLEPKFRHATGMSLAAAIAKARIDRARDLLATTDLSIKEIAFLVGFSEPRMLTLVFKGLTGELPSDYRHRARSAAP